jgi:hypothetical protein
MPVDGDLTRDALPRKVDLFNRFAYTGFALQISVTQQVVLRLDVGA